MPLLTGEPVAGAGAETTSTVLGGVVVSFSGALEASAGRRQALKRLVTTHGGRIVYILSKQVTHLVVGEEDVDELLRQQQQDQLVDSRVRKAQELGLQVVSDRWLLDSVAARTLLDDIPYSFSWKQRMLLQGLSVNTRPEEYCLSRLVAGMRDVRLLSQAVGFDDAMKGRTSARSQQQLAARPRHGSNEPSWAVSLRAKREQLLTERRLDKERKRREEKERKRQEAERLRQREREGQQDWKRYRAQRSQERRDDQRVKKLERLEANWCEERVRIEARAREKRKEKIIRMLLWEKRKIDERTKELRDIKRAQDTKEARLALWEEWERKKSVWRRQEAFESGRKIFVGGFKFDDVADEGESKARFIVEKRKEHLRALFASFGPILAVREQWAKEFVFVLYKEPEDAARAFEAIRDSERRRSMVEFIKRGLVDNGEPSVYAPSPSFYVRWPRQKYAGRRGGVRSPGAQTKANDEQQQKKEEEAAKRKEEAKEKKKLEKKERKKREREERKEKRKSEKRAVVEQMKARGETTTPAAIARQMKKMKKNEGGGQPQITKTAKPTSDRTKKTSDNKPKSQTKKNEDDAGAKQDKETKKTKQTKKKNESNGDQHSKPAYKATEKKDTKKPTTTQAPTTALERREKRERELAELRAKSLEELEDALDVLQSGRRELIRGWRRGWETPDETRRWHRLLFEKEKKRRRLQREAERLQRKRDELAQRRLARFEARKRERLEQRERELNEARQRMVEIRRSLGGGEACERERQRKRDEALEAKRLRNERERARVALEIAQMRAALRLQKNRRRRARKRHEAAIKEDEAARLADLRRQEEEERRGGGTRKPTTTVVAVAAASSAHHLLKSRAGGRKDDSWIVAAFALLCVLVFVCALYL